MSNFSYYVRTSASKIIDGLFIGNKEASQDVDFIVSNKIGSIINCAGNNVPASMRRFGCKYLTYRWVDCASTIIFDSKGKFIKQIHKFIEDAFENGESVLIHSVDARACCVVLAYLIYNFHWTIGQALAFTQSRRPEINPKSYYIKQLKVSVKGLGLDDDEIIVSVTNNKWQSNSTCTSANEIVVRNTYLNNNQLIVEADRGLIKVPIQVDCEDRCNCSCCKNSAKKERKLQWSDDISNLNQGFVLHRPPGAGYSLRTGTPQQPVTPHPHTNYSNHPHKDLNLAKSFNSTAFKSPRTSNATGSPLMITPRPNEPNRAFEASPRTSPRNYSDIIENDDDPTPRKEELNKVPSFKPKPDSKHNESKAEQPAYLVNLVHMLDTSKEDEKKLNYKNDNSMMNNNLANTLAALEKSNADSILSRRRPAELNIKSDHQSSITFARNSIDLYKTKIDNPALELNSSNWETPNFSTFKSPPPKSPISPAYNHSPNSPNIMTQQRPSTSSAIRKLPQSFQTLSLTGSNSNGLSASNSTGSLNNNNNSLNSPASISSSFIQGSGVNFNSVLTPPKKPTAVLTRPLTAGAIVSSFIKSPPSNPIPLSNTPVVRSITPNSMQLTSSTSPTVNNLNLNTNSIMMRPSSLASKSPLNNSVNVSSIAVSNAMLPGKAKTAISARPKTPAMLANAWRQYSASK